MCKIARPSLPLHQPVLCELQNRTKNVSFSVIYMNFWLIVLHLHLIKRTWCKLCVWLLFIFTTECADTSDWSCVPIIHCYLYYYAVFQPDCKINQSIILLWYFQQVCLYFSLLCCTFTSGTYNKELYGCYANQILTCMF